MGEKQSRQMLRLLFWESTIKCNLACAHCRRIESDEAVVTDLTTGQARDMIAQLAVLGKQQPFMPVLVFSGGCGGSLRVRADLHFGDPWVPDPACYLTDEEIDLDADKQAELEKSREVFLMPE